MERITCAGSTFVTGGLIAAAVIDYAHILAQQGEFDVIELPTRRTDGSAGRARLLVGPTTQIASETVQLASDELTDLPLVDELRERAARLRRPQRPAADPGRHAEDVEPWFDL